MSKDKDLDYSKFSKEQIQAARYMADPDCGMTLKQIAKEVGVHERTIYRWREDREFLDFVNELADRYMDSFLSQVYRQLQRSVNNGSVKAIELALKRAGKQIERKEVSGEVNVEVNAINGKTNEQLALEIAELEKRMLEGKAPSDTAKEIIDADFEVISDEGDTNELNSKD